MFKSIINSKWFTITLMVLGPLVFMIGRTTGNWLPQLVLIPIIYIVVLATRNNYIWYFCFEFAILVLAVSSILLIHRHLDISLWCLFGGVALMVLYAITVKIMDTRGYPVKRQKTEE